MKNSRKKIGDKELYLGVKIPLFSLAITSIVAVICVFLTHYFTLKEIDYESALQIVKENATVEELLLDAQKYYSIGEYAETIHIYNMDVMEVNAVALNNLGYMYENGVVYGKNIEKAREYYERAATLGNSESMENYIIFTIKHPKSFKNLLNVLNLGFENKSEAVYEFIGDYYRKGDVSQEDIQSFLQMDYERQIEVLKYQVDTRLKDETEEIADEMIQEKAYYETEEMMFYKELTDDSYGSGIFRRKAEVNIPVPIGEIRAYYIDFLFGYEHDTKFIFL